MPTSSHSLVVNAPQSQIFAILDAVRRMPGWLTRCTGIDKIDDGPNKDDKRIGEMDATDAMTRLKALAES